MACGRKGGKLFPVFRKVAGDDGFAQLMTGQRVAQQLPYPASPRAGLGLVMAPAVTTGWPVQRADPALDAEVNVDLVERQFSQAGLRLHPFRYSRCGFKDWRIDRRFRRQILEQLQRLRPQAPAALLVHTLCASNLAVMRNKIASVTRVILGL